MKILGLTHTEAKKRLEVEGPNELPTLKSRKFLELLKEVLLEPMVALLLSCGIIYFFLGNNQEALMLLGFLFIIVFITIYQENKTEKALEALRNLSSPRALVMRENQKKRIPGREVVREDIIILSEGDRVPADANIIFSSNLIVDESLLTGESVPVHKQNNEKVFAGTTVVRGHATTSVFATGMNTELGRIGKVLETAKTEVTELQIETTKLVKIISILASALCILVVIVYGFTRNDWLNGFLSGLTLAMAILPNELPAVLMIFLALGAWRISKRNVLTRKMASIENLGCATVLCVDKTGTLTMNQMIVQKLSIMEEDFDLRIEKQLTLPEKFHSLVEYGVLASSPAQFDPMEKAVHEIGDEYLKGTEHLHPEWILAREYPLSPEILAVSHAWKGMENEGFIVGAKGAPEAIIDLCHLGEDKTKNILKKAEELAKEGLRILGVAKATYNKSSVLPGKQHDYDFEFLGLLGFTDPVRSNVPEAILECNQAGIRVIMITGDHANTAKTIAKEIGISNPEETITGPELLKMSDKELSQKIKTVNCFARMVPEQKLRLVTALKNNNEVVAMTGDGVNDAPALKTAQIGIAMGGRGTDVARESASLVLLDDEFFSIVEAIRIGRRIFDNLKSAMAYLMAIHIPIAGISVLPVILNKPLVLMPIHIAFLHLIIEPACSIVFEAEPIAGDAMRRNPRGRNEPLFSKNLILPSLIQGLVIFAAISGIFLFSLKRGQGEFDARALTFTTLIFSNLGLIIVNRSWSRTFLEGLKVPNKALWWIIIGSLALISVVLYIPFFRELFRFSFLHPIDILICVGVGLISSFWFEWWKILKRSRFKKSNQNR
jgi:P-type Ca2+ transporter type 2C